MMTPALKLNNGVAIPALGLGVFQSYKAAEKVLADGRANAIGVSNFSAHLRMGGPDPELLSPETYPKTVDNS